MKSITTETIKNITYTIHCVVYNNDIKNNIICFKAFNKKNIDNDAECIDISNKLLKMGYDAIYLGSNNIKINDVRFDNISSLINEDVEDIKESIRYITKDNIINIVKDKNIILSVVNKTTICLYSNDYYLPMVNNLIKHGIDARIINNHIFLKNHILIMNENISVDIMTNKNVYKKVNNDISDILIKNKLYKYNMYCKKINKLKDNQL